MIGDMGRLWPLLYITVLLTGVNVLWWGMIGLVRAVVTRAGPGSHRRVLPHPTLPQLRRSDVAVLMAAYNEALVISTSIRSLLASVAAQDIYIVSDGSTDATAALARELGVHVLEVENSGKASALQAGVTYFQLADRYVGVLFVDADTIIDPTYVDRALRYLADPRVAAVAGFARTVWQPARTPAWNMLFIAHRERVYLLVQYVLKYAQAWFGCSVTPIVPGFCSLYRAAVLPAINIAAPGLVIEDYNMTFEVHKQKLGTIILDPAITARTQDPDTYTDYYHQVRRWHLGFWQTLRRHGFWPSTFSLALLVYCIEMFVAACSLVCLPLLLGVLAYGAWADAGSSYSQSYAVHIGIVLVWIWGMDYAVSILMAIIFRKPQFVWYGPFFLALRYVDAWTFIAAFPRAFLEQSTGRWQSPTRRMMQATAPTAPESLI